MKNQWATVDAHVVGGAGTFLPAMVSTCWRYGFNAGSVGVDVVGRSATDRVKPLAWPRIERTWPTSGARRRPATDCQTEPGTRITSGTDADASTLSAFLLESAQKHDSAVLDRPWCVQSTDRMVRQRGMGECCSEPADGLAVRS